MNLAPALLTGLAAWALGGCAVQESPGIRVLTEGPGSPALEVNDLQGLSDFAARDPGLEEWQSVLALFVVTGSEEVGDQPAVLGNYQATGNALRFEPRYGLAPGLTYRARLDVSALDAQRSAAAPGQLVEQLFSLPQISMEPTTAVQAIYPTADVLPENNLKFYIHFNAPMGQGKAYDHVRLLDAQGEEVEWAFLQLGEELWDPTGTRFTLLFDPGRIKRGLQPREELGPSLEQGRTYTLLVDRDWLDAEGKRLVGEFRKGFAAVEPVMTRVDPSTWELQTPQAGTHGPLVVDMMRSMDHALLQRMLWVVDTRGDQVLGDVLVEEREARWVFSPREPWGEGDYQLVMDTTLEDVSGNKIKAAFDVDVFEPGVRRLEIETTSIPFRVSR